MNFPIRLNNKLAAVAGVVSMGDWRPTAQALAVKKELTAKIDLELAKLEELFGREIPAMNEAIRKAGIPTLLRGVKLQKGTVEAGARRR